MAAATSSRTRRMTPLEFMRRNGRSVQRMSPEEWAEYFDVDVRQMLEPLVPFLEFEPVGDWLEREGWPAYTYRGFGSVRVIGGRRRSGYSSFLFFTQDHDWLWVEYHENEREFHNGYLTRENFVRLFRPGGLFPSSALQGIGDELIRQKKQMEEDLTLIQKTVWELEVGIESERTLHFP